VASVKPWFWFGTRRRSNEAAAISHSINFNGLKSSDDLGRETLSREAQKDLAEASKVEKTKFEKVGTEKIKLDNVKSNKTNIENTNAEKISDVAKAKKVNQKLNSYEAAEHYLNEQDWKKAIINFQKYTEESPRGKHVADAKYKIGVCFQELGMKEEAMAFYEEVVANYGDTVAGKKSKTRLRSFKK
jgi:TolA-binding protein